MIGGEWKRAGGDRQNPLLVRFRLYRTPVGVISRLILFRLAAFWGRSAMAWSVPFSLGKFLVEGPILAYPGLVDGVGRPADQRSNDGRAGPGGQMVRTSPHHANMQQLLGPHEPERFGHGRL
jgi:hypothetical protein